MNPGPKIALAFMLSAAAARADALKLPEDLSTAGDGRARIQELFEAYAVLRDKGWVLDVITTSQPQGTRQAIPIIALRTALSGPATWIITGIHGEEPAGPNAVARSIDVIAEAGEHHPLVLIPLANPHGYVRNWRYLNSPVRHEDVEGQSVGDSSHLLAEAGTPVQARARAASSPEADAITRYVLETARDYQPRISIDLHEDDAISGGYVYSQGIEGQNEPLAQLAVETLRASGVTIQMDGKTDFDEPISAGIIGIVTDSSIDELMSAAQVVVGGSLTSGPAAPIVLVIETPSTRMTLEERIRAHQAVLARLLGH